MANKFNPFRPNHPVYTGMFVGRMNELAKIDKAFFQAKKGNPINILVTGERGIGKSSLLLVAKAIASGDIELSGDKFNFLKVYINIDEKTTLQDLASKIGNNLERELKTNETMLSHIKATWGFVKMLESDVIRIKTQDTLKKDSELLDKFIFSLVDTVKAITSKEEAVIDLHCKKDGLIILIDEADRASAELNLGGFLKSLSERIVAEDCNNVLLIVAGLPKLHDVILQSHESSLRMFEELILSTLSAEEVKVVINRGLAEAKEKSGVDVVIDEDSCALIVEYSEGYPHFVQQIGYSVFEIDTDNHITADDVRNAMTMKGGVIDILGDRYYKDLYYNKIEGEAYREILRIMASKWNQWIKKSEIRSKFKGTQATLDNGLQALTKRNIILPQVGVRGVYRLQWASFALWIQKLTESKKPE